MKMMKSKTVLASKAFIIIFATLYLCLMVALKDLLSDITMYSLLTIGLFVVSFSMCTSLVKARGRYYLFSLTTLFLMFQFIVQVCIGNIAYYSNQTYYFPGWDYMKKTMFVMYTAALGYICGMDSKVWASAGEKIHEKFFTKWETNYNVNLRACIIVFIIVIPLYMWGMSTGLIGYETSNTVTAVSNIKQVVVYLSHLMTMALYILFIDILKNRKRNERLVFVVFLVVRLFMALLSGMKADIILMFACLFIIYLVCVGKANKMILFLGSLATLLIYNLNNVFRALLRNEAYNSFTRSELLFISVRQILLGGDVLTGVNNSFLMRLGITESCGSVIRYIDLHGLTENDPTFFKDFILIPLSTFLPRAILPWKSVLNYGVWVTQVVHGTMAYSSSYLTIEGFFYSIGGFITVFLGFYFLAIFLEFVSSIIKVESMNEVMLCTFLMICTTQIFEPNDPVTMIMGIIRGIIIYPILGKILIRHRKI